MRKLTKRILICGAVALGALVAVYCLLRFAFSIDVLDQSGWHSENGAVRYLDYWGRPHTGWQTIEGKNYYFADDGHMITGWHELDGLRYYFGEDGARSCGWLERDGQRFYLGEDGVMHTGWLTLDKATHYFADENGAMVTGWLQLEDQSYYFTPENGTLASGWLQLDGKHYYLTDQGHTVSGWVELEGVRYLFNADGSAVTGWFEDDSGRYFFAEDGRPQSGWLEWEQKRYYLNDDGSVTTGWLTLEDERYYFLPTGRMAIGRVEVDGDARFFTSKGKEVLFCNPWNAIPEDFEPNLVNFDGYQIDADASEPLRQMMEACRADGIGIGINNTYRSHSTQKRMWDNRIEERMAAGMTKEEAEAKTGESLAIPGHSEHETGLALDINSGSSVYKWMAENCWDYGFILRYPSNKMDITGIIYEPWHFRYVGTELSLELEELGLCMEEYITMLTEQQSKIAD